MHYNRFKTFVTKPDGEVLISEPWTIEEAFNQWQQGFVEGTRVIKQFTGLLDEKGNEIYEELVDNKLI